jgi:opacity protein-like surface antigen
MMRSVSLVWVLAAAVLAGAQCASGQEVTYSYVPDAPEFNIMGFGDIGYISEDSSDNDGFVIGQAVGHLTASLGHSLSVFSEVSATARDSEYSLEIERLIVKYEFSDRYKLSAGRYHSPIGYWNQAFHHGAWLQTTVARPEVFKFGSSIVPIHFVGVLLEGDFTKTELGLGYKVGFGNGRHQNIARAGDAGDINGDKAWMVQVTSNPRKLRGLNLGLGYYSDEVSLLDGQTVEEGTASAYLVWSNRRAELIAEYLASNHELTAAGGQSGDVHAWYAQFAYQLPDELKDWKPYARFEHTRIDDSDPLLGQAGLEYDAGILGVRWDFNPYAALKAEYRNEEFADTGRENNFRLQLAFVLARL